MIEHQARWNQSIRSRPNDPVGQKPELIPAVPEPMENVGLRIEERSHPMPVNEPPAKQITKNAPLRRIRAKIATFQQHQDEVIYVHLAACPVKNRSHAGARFVQDQSATATDRASRPMRYN